jgi:hypothetical protein
VLGQLGERVRLRWLVAAEVVRDPLRDGRAEDGLAVGDAADGTSDFPSPTPLGR